MKFTFARIQIAYFLTSVAILTTLVYYAYESKERYDEEKAAASFHHQVINETAIISSGVRDARGYAYGYTLTADSSFIVQYSAATDTVALHLKQLKQLALQRPSLRANVDSLEYYLTKRMVYSQQLIDLRTKEGLMPVVAKVSKPYGLSLMTTVGRFISAIQQQESMDLKEKEAETAEQLNSYYIALTLLITLGLVLFIVIFISNRYYITARHKAVADLRKSLKDLTDFKLALDSAAIVAITDRQGTLLHANDMFCRVSKYSHAELIGANHQLLNSGHHTQEFFKHMYATMAEGKVWRGEIKKKAKDNSFYWVDTTIVPFMNEDGKPYQHLIISYDISERKAVEDKLQQLNAELEKRVEERTRESESRKKYFKALIENSSDAILLINEKGILVYQSPAAEKISGYSITETYGKPAGIYLLPEDLADVKKTMDELALMPGASVTKQYRIRHKKGHVIWLEGTVSNRLDDEHVKAFISNYRDITERKVIELALAESEAFHKGVLSSLASHIAVVDKTGRIIEVNRAWNNFANENGDTLLLGTGKGTNYFEVCRKSAESGDTTARNALRGMQDVLDNKLPEFYMEYPCHSPHEHRWFAMRVKNFETDKPMIVVTHLDITARKIAEEKSQESERNLSNVFDNTSDSIWSVDREHRLISFNKPFAERFRSFTFRDPIIGEVNTDTLPEEFRPDLKAKYDRALNGEYFTDEEHYIFYGQKHCFWVRYNPIFQEGKVTGIAIFATNVTEQKLAEEKLQESERNLSNVFDNTSDNIWSVDKEHRLISFNKTFIESFRLFTLRDPIMGEVNTDTVPEEFRPDLKAKYNRALGGEHFTVEESYIFNGQRHWFWVRYNPIIQLGEVIGIALFSTNITEQKLAEEKLQESERNLSNVFNNTSDSIWSVDIDQRFISFNKAFAEEFHFFSNRYPVIGESSLDTVREDFRPSLKAIYNRALEGESITLEEDYTLNGNRYWYSVRYNPIVKDNEVTGIAVFSSDITKRKLAEEAVQQSHEKLRKLTEKVAVAIYQFNMAPDGTMSFPFMSKGIEQILQGVTPEQILKDVSIPFSSVHPEDLPLLMQSIEESRQNLTPWNVDYRNITKTGEIKWFKGSSVPEKKEDGTVIWYGYLEDFTAHREALEKLDALTFELQTLFNSIDEVLFSVDMVNYRTTQMSPACEKLYGYPPADFFSDPNLWKKVIHPDDAYIIDDGYLKMEKGVPFEMEYRIIRKDRELRWIHASIKPSLDNASKLVRIDGIVRDITLRKKVEDLIKNTNEQLELRVRERTTELLEANTALEAFSYSVSHDLRSPLRTLIGISRMISKEYGRSLRPEVQDLFSHIEITGKRMYAIVEDLLKLARFSKEKLHTSEVNMNELFSTIWNNLQTQSPNNAAIEIDPLPLVKADESMLQQVILNLLSNAIKYSSKKIKPQIKVGYKETEKDFVFYIKDNGTGFDMEFYDRLFTPFQRLHSLQEFEGTGVGLTVAKRIIERHHGEIWAVSKVDEGATFYFTLPIY